MLSRGTRPASSIACAVFSFRAGYYDPFTGADVAYTDSDTSDIYSRYSIYYFGHGAGNPVPSFVAASSAVSLIFAGAGLQEAGDEFWALDNVRVSLPEPDGLALFAAGLAPLAGSAIRRGKRAG
jgi:hypothetical protein